MASIKRVLPALAIAAVVLLGGSGSYSKTASKAKAKPAIKAAAPVKWITRTNGRFTFSVPSNWKIPKSAPADAVGWYIGSNENMPAGGFACMWQKMSDEEMKPLADMKKGPNVDFSGIAAAEYTSIDGKAHTLFFVGDKPERDGKRLIVMAASVTGEWQKYEPTLRKIMSSIKIAPEEAPAKTEPSPATP